MHRIAFRNLLRPTHRSLSLAMPAIPASYKAYVYERFGKVEDILTLKDVAVEALPPAQVRIHVRSAALNPIDFKIPELYGAAFTNGEPSAEAPYRIGFDVAGVIAEVGSDVTKFKVGDEVFAMAALRTFGTLAQYVSTDEQYVARKPTTLDFNHAAAVPLAALTSYQALNHHGSLRAGEKVLILGGSSSTGIFAIQYANSIGAHVIATTSTKNVAFVESLGADHVIDYTAEKKWSDVLDRHSIDVVYDCAVEPASWESAAQEVLKQETGRFVTLKRGLKPSPAKYGATYKEVLTNSSGRDLSEIARLIDAGKVKSVIDSVFAFDDVAAAFSKLKTGRAVGKVVVQVAEE